MYISPVLGINPGAFQQSSIKGAKNKAPNIMITVITLCLA